MMSIRRITRTHFMSFMLITVRRIAIVLSTTAAFAPAFGGGALAQDATGSDAYPNKPIRFIVPFPSGGFSDILGRFVGQKLSESVRQPVVIDNRPGASGNIGAEIVAKAPPNGYTLLINSLNYVINPSVLQLPFDPLKDFVPVSLIADGPPLIMVVNPASAYRSVQDVITLARSKPGQLNFATAGPGTSTHLAAELFRTMAGIVIVLVPYKGGTAEFSSVVSGETAVNFPLLPAALPLLQGGRLRALAVTSAKRSPALPELPTMAESGLPGFEAANFLGLVAPANTPRSIILKLHIEIASMSRQRDFVERLERFGMQPVGSTPDEFEKFIEQQIRKWAGVVRTAGSKQQP